MKLPKKVKRTEAAIDTRVAERFRKLHTHRNFAMEVKLTKNKVAPHQLKALKQVENGTFLYKIPDMGRRNPFDFISLGDADAVVCWVTGKDVLCDVNGGTISYKFKL